MASACAVCFESFNHSSRVPTTCPYCAVQTCRTCLQTYLLHDISDTPCCVNPDCGHGYSREFLDGELTQTFRLKTYKAHREKVLSDRERARFPSTQADVRAYVDAKARSSALHAEMVALQARCTELTRLHDAAWHTSQQRQSDWKRYLAAIRPFRKQLQLFRRELLPMRRIVESFGRVSHSHRDEPAVSRHEFIKPCPSDACKGFLSTSWKCGLCDLWSCPACHEVKGRIRDAPHTCDPDKVRTVQLIAKEARPCPKCGVPICKIEGCDQMWCTNCNTGFHWRTGRLADGPIHNPHYFAWLRSIRVAQPTATQRSAAYLGENPCDDVAVDRAIVDALRGTTGATEKFMLRAWQLMRELQHDDLRVRARVDLEEKRRQLRVRYMANEMNEAAWKVALQRCEKDAHFHTAEHHVRDVFVTASRDLLRQIVQPGVDMEQVKVQLEALLAYCNAASERVSQRFMRRATTYELGAH